jgi:DNA-binding transcriptional MerR regulator
VSEQGKYRIQAVAEMTGVPSATLRAWERRYGLPTPARTSSSYRVYSEDDIALIRKIRELCDAGMAPAEAAQAVLNESQRLEDRETAAPASADPYEAATARVVQAVERFDPLAVETAVRHAMFLGPARQVYEAVMAPAMREVGQRWHEGVFSIGQEHMATEVIGNAVRDMLRLVQPVDGARKALLACFADEEHTMPLYGVAFRFVEWGFKTVVLGAKTPPGAIRHAVEEIRPSMVGLSCTLAPPGYRARELIDQYADAAARTPWLVGGADVGKLRPLVEARGGIVVESWNGATLRAELERLIAKPKDDTSRHG